MGNCEEQWVEIPRKCTNRTVIKAVSSLGRIKYQDDTVVDSELRQYVNVAGKPYRIYRVVADHFLITVRRPDQTQVDHITHNPTDYAVNDVRNLRYCTQSENTRFPEARENKSRNNWLRGKGYLVFGEKSQRWKGVLATEETKKHREITRRYRAKRKLLTNSKPDSVSQP